jgi:ATP-binding cassette subfamily F protein uup
VATLTVLEDALRDFGGAVILVTHDRYFMDQVAHHILAFHKNPEGHTTLETFAGYLQWEEWFEEQKEAEVLREQQKRQEAKKEAKANKPGKLSFKEKFEYDGMEATILGLEEKLKGLQADSAKPEVASAATKLQEIYAELAKTQAQLDKLYARWTELENKVKGEG